jgi:hypothetical protein
MSPASAETTSATQFSQDGLPTLVVINEKKTFYF